MTVSNQATVVISREAVQRLKHGHPWVYESEVIDVHGADAGDAVRIQGENGWSLGVGFFSDSSSITVRRIDHRDIFLDHDFLSSRLAAANLLRRELLGDQTAYRMLNAEADGLPGLLIDRYADTLVLQSICQGSDRILDEVVDILRREYAPAQIIVRNDHPERRREGLDTNVNILHGSTEGLINYEEGSLRLSINALSGDVTGTYLDQQRNHQWVSSFAHGRGLDLYCYSGGFALHMAQRCNSILAVDNAASPLTLGELDGQSNQLDNVSWHNNDVMAFLESANRSGETFDSIVVDPPGNIDSDTYEQILGRVFRVAQVRAFVLVFTRRYPMQRQQFEHQVLHTAAESGRRVQLLARRGPSWDHPILATLPETELLAGLLLRLV